MFRNKSFNLRGVNRMQSLQAWRRGASALCAIFMLLLTGVARAEDSTLPPVPLANVVDQNGMNLTTGYWQQPGPTISIGPAGQGGLSFTWMWGQGVRNPYSNTVKHPYGDTSKREVSVLGKTELFTYDSGWVSETGGSLTESSGNYTYTDKFGLVAYFPAASLTCAADYCTVGLGSTVTFPNGEVWSFVYRTQGGVFAVASVNTNLGYQIKFNFASSNPFDGGYMRYNKILAINNAVEYCDPSPSATCNNTGWPQMTWASTSANCFSGATSGEEVTDTAGEIWRICTKVTDHDDYVTVEDKVEEPSGQYTWHSYDRPDDGSPFTNQRAWKSNSGQYWAYDVDSGTTEVTDPNGVVRQVTSNTETGQPSADALNPSGINLASYWSYDGDDRLTSASSPNGDSVTLTYSTDNRGNVTQRTQTGVGNPLSTTYAYPSCGNQKTCNKPSSITDANGNTTDYTYSTDHGGVLTVQGPAVNGVRTLTTTSYSQFQAFYYTGPSTISGGGSVWLPTGTTTCTNANSCSGTAAERVTALTYVTGSSGVAGNILNTQTTVKAGDNSISSTTEVTYDNIGNVTASENALGHSTAYFYDLMRRQIGVVGPSPGSSIFPATKTVYDDAGRVLEVHQGTTAGQSSSDFNAFSSLAKSVSEYDSVTGALIKQTSYIGSGAFGVVQYSYDPGGRLTCTARRQATSSLPSDACDRQSPGDKDLISQNNYDAANRVTSITTGVDSGTTITALTNGFSGTYPGRIDTIKDGKNNLSTFTYNGTTRRLEKIEFPSKTTPNTSDAGDYESYTYDNQGNILSKRLRSGETVTLTYDARNRLSTKSLPGGANPLTVYAYDQVDDLLSARYGSASGSGVVYSWDALGRKLTEAAYNADTSVTRTVTSAYDALGNRTCLKYPDVGSQAYHIEYTYDVLGRMMGVRQRGSATCGSGSVTTLAEYTYDNLGRVTNIARANSAPTSASYNSSSQSWDLTQNLDGSGQDVTFGMTYTPAGQLSDRSISNSSYRYGVSSGATTNYCSNGLNQYATVGGASGSCSGGQAYAYDNRGNLTSDGSRTFAYDLENKLVQATGAGSVGTPTNWNAANWNAFQWSGAPTSYFGYDPQGRLIQLDSASGTDQYLYDGGARLVEYNAGGTVQRRYVPGQGVDETLVWYEGSNFSTPSWLHTDQQGSIVAVSNGSGASTATYVYGPFGEPSGGFASGGPAFRYTGQAQLPNVALYYYKARMYDPALGRFLQTDPLGYSQGMNLYAYVMNDPMNNIDPTGTQDLPMESITSSVYSSQVGGQDRCGETLATFYLNTGGSSGCRSPSEIALMGLTFTISGVVDIIETVVKKLTPTQPCPVGPSADIGGGVSATGFLGLFGASIGLNGNIAIPMASLKSGSLRGIQFSLSASGTPLAGVGLFLGAGKSYSAGGTTPREAGFDGSITPVGQAGAGDGAGVELASDMTWPPNFSGSGGRIAGGAYAAAGVRFSGTLASPRFGCR